MAAALYARLRAQDRRGEGSIPGRGRRGRGSGAEGWREGHAEKGG